MLNTYTIVMPTPAKALALGVKLEGFDRRILHWVSGISFGLSAVDSAIDFQLIHQDKNSGTITVRCNSTPLIGSMQDWLDSYGVNVIQTPDEETENAIYPMADWRDEVAAKDTRLGYKEWVSHQIESNRIG